MSFETIAAVISALAAVVSVVAAVHAGRQSRDLGLEANRISAESLATNADRIRNEQASRVAAFEVPASSIETEAPSAFCLTNSSDGPIYEAGVVLEAYGHEFNSGGAPPASDRLVRLAVVPPGKWLITFDNSIRGMSKIQAAELAFTDQAGRHWLRTTSGDLRHLDTSMIEHYGVQLPFTPTPLTPYDS